MGHVTLVMAAYLFKVQRLKDSMLLTMLLIFYNNFLLYNKQKILGMRIFPKIPSVPKTLPVKVTSTTFLLRDVEQLAVNQFLSNSAI